MSSPALDSIDDLPATVAVDPIALSTTELCTPLRLESSQCCLCESQNGEPIAVGQDYEFQVSPDQFLMMRCGTCGLVYLNPTPALSEFARIYPKNYHAFEFSAEQYGFVYYVRRRLEARRLLALCRGLRDDARILDVGSGDGFHLGVLRDYGKKTWTLEGVDTDERAVAIGNRSGLKIHHGSLESVGLPKESFDLVLLIQTVEHVVDPPELLRQIRSLLRPGGRLVLVTDNTGSLDFRFFKGCYWGGYHFPRHRYLFNSNTMRVLAAKAELDVEKLTTAISPVNWTYSIHNALVDFNAPQWLVNRFSLKATITLGFFTVFDTLHKLMGRGALLHAVLRRPR